LLSFEVFAPNVKKLLLVVASLKKSEHCVPHNIKPNQEEIEEEEKKVVINIYYS